MRLHEAACTIFFKMKFMQTNSFDLAAPIVVCATEMLRVAASACLLVLVLADIDGSGSKPHILLLVVDE